MTNNYSARSKKSNQETKKTNFIVKFLWFCSGANGKVLERCQASQGNYATIGFTILITAMMASLGGGYALWTFFKSQPMAIGFGAFWGLTIGNLDRFLVSSIRKGDDISAGQWFLLGSRVVGAVAIAFVIAKPLEIKIFEKPIEAARQEKISLKDTAERDRLDKKYSPKVKLLQNQNQPYSQELENLLNQVNLACDAANKEALGKGQTGKYGAGPVHAALQADCDKQRAIYQKRKNDLQPIIDKNNADINALNSAQKTELNALSTTQKDADDLMTKIEVLENLGRDKPIYNWSSWFITFIFVFIDVTPIIVKILSPKSVYDEELTDEEAKQIQDNKNKRQDTADRIQDENKKRKEIDKANRDNQHIEALTAIVAQSNKVNAEHQAIQAIANHPDYQKTINDLTEERFRQFIDDLFQKSSSSTSTQASAPPPQSGSENSSTSPSDTASASTSPPPRTRFSKHS